MADPLARLKAAAAWWEGRALELERECGDRETLVSAQARLRGAVLNFMVAALGPMPDCFRRLLDRGADRG